MNCPGHIIIFKQGIKSYRDLPLRFGEFGNCHRNEPTGSLHGIMRVRAFTQDDGHIFCTEDQIQAEVTAFTSLLQKVYADFGFTNILYRLSTRPENVSVRTKAGTRQRTRWPKVCVLRVASSNICPVKVPSTAPRSSTR